jgi:hypothetical protein
LLRRQPESFETNISSYNFHISDQLARPDKIQRSLHSGPCSGIGVGPHEGEQFVTGLKGLSSNPTAD